MVQISLKHAMAAFGGASASRGSLGNALVTVNDVLPPLVLLLFVPSISRDLVVGSAVLTTQYVCLCVCRVCDHPV